MHLHYFSLQKIAELINKRVSGGILVETFSQNKDELVLGIGSPEDELYLRIACGSPMPFIWPVDAYGKARKNVTTLFSGLINLPLLSARAIHWDRVLVLEFPGERQLALKMHGNQSNVILLKKGKIIEIFRNSLQKDLAFRLVDGKEPRTDQDRKDQEETNESPNGSVKSKIYALTYDEIRKELAALSPVFDRNFAERGFALLHPSPDPKLKKAEPGKILSEISMPEIPDLAQAPENFPNLVAQLNKEALDDCYYITKNESKIKFSLFPPGIKIKGVQVALDFFLRNYYQLEAYKQQYSAVKRALIAPLQKLEGKVASYQKNLLALQKSRSAEEIGSILMANLHTLQSGLESAELFDFYTNETISIKLNPRLNPQQNAAHWFGKQKKRKAKSLHLHSLIKSLEAKINVLKITLADFEGLPQPGDLQLDASGFEPEPGQKLRKFLKKEGIESSTKPLQQISKPYYCYEFGGFEILVGKNAAGNDELTQQIASKEDLWLHARGVRGSHVVIRNPTRKDVPMPVIEYAASLAARYSKAQHEGLVSVIYTPRKHVRKPKKAAPGAVLVEKEKVILIEPAQR